MSGGNEHEARWGSSLLVILSLLSFYAAELYGLLSYPDLMARATDTENYRLWAQATQRYASSPVDISVINPVQGLGGLSQPNAPLHPAYGPAYAWFSEPWSSAVAYLLAILLLSLATLALARALGVRWFPAVVMVQLLCYLSFPPHFWAPNYEPLLRLNGALLYFLAGGFAVGTGLGVLCLALLVRLGRDGPRANACWLVATPAVALYAVLADPLYAAVLGLPAGLFGVVRIFGASSRRELRWVLGCVALGLAALLLTGVVPFYRALNGYMARALFPNEIYVEVQTWDHLTTMAFQGPVSLALVGAVAVGCALCLKAGDRLQRAIAAGVAGYLVLMIGLTLVYIYGGVRWGRLPLPAYLELGAQPVYAVVLVLGGQLGWRRLRSRVLPALERTPLTRLPPMACRGAVLAIGPLLALLGPVPESDWPPLPEQATPGSFSGALARELAVGPGDPFRGSVVNTIGVPGGELARALKVPDEAPRTAELIAKTTLAVRKTVDQHLFLAGLWQLGVPTLEDNNHLVTPPFYYLVSRALSRPQDYHARNMALVSRPRPHLLAALGARFLVTDRELDDPWLQECARYTNPYRLTVRLYELRDPNLGDYSPTRAILVEDAAGAIARLIDPSVDLREQAVVFEPLPELVPARAARLSFERGGARLEAESPARSLLVLPLQFSNSLRLTDAEGAAVELRRVNLLQTGVLFEGSINVKLAHVFGLFRGLAGRQQDIADCERLGIVETGSVPYPPDYQPHAWGQD